ncbi:MAG: pilin [Minisyncoccia bacterium]
MNITNAQLSTTQCPASCPQGQQCIRKDDGNLDCRETATNCSPACTGNTVCVKAIATDTSGSCVDDAPASARPATSTTGPAATPTTGTGAGGTNPTGLADGLTTFGTAGSGLNTTGTLIGYIANIIRWVLGLLGTVFFVIIVLQGYLYMTAGGDASKTSSAISAIGNAVIGLLIIMGAFLITNYVTSALINSGGGSSTETGTGAP